MKDEGCGGGASEGPGPSAERVAVQHQAGKPAGFRDVSSRDSHLAEQAHADRLTQRNQWNPVSGRHRVQRIHALGVDSGFPDGIGRRSVIPSRPPTEQVGPDRPSSQDAGTVGEETPYRGTLGSESFPPMHGNGAPSRDQAEDVL